MLPWVYEFRWEPTHLVFLSAFFSVSALIAGTVVRASVRSVRSLRDAGNERIAWKAAFEDLPASARMCRHQITGEVKQRQCVNAFLCSECSAHRRFLDRHSAPAAGRAIRGGAPEVVGGIRLPVDRYYDRGHTWARLEGDGTFTVGIDDLGRRMLGEVVATELPAAGTSLRVHDPAFRVHTATGWAELRSPLDGEVVETSTGGNDWHLRLKMNPEGSIAHLLRGAELKSWMMRELERLQMALSDKKVGFSLADGGVPVESMPSAAPGKNWEAVWDEMFLAS